MARKNQTEYEVIQKKFFGANEPSLDAHLADALNWYSSVCDDKDARGWLKEYLKEADRSEEINQLNLIPDDWIPRTAAWLARLALRGYLLSEHNFETIEKKLKDAFCHQTMPEKTLVPKVKPNVQEYIREKASELIGEVEGMIDDKVNIPPSFYNFLRSREVSGLVANRMLTHFAPIADELIEAMETDDEDLKEGYRVYSNKELENLAITYQSIVDDLNQYIGNVKKARKPRAKKKPSMEKLLKNFSYCKSENDYQLVSVDPSKIVGATELWTFNPKKMALAVYRSNDSDGLNIRRSVIVNINEKTSLSKKIGRKTSEKVKLVLNSGKVALRKVMDDISGKGNEVGRITKDTILLRVL